MPISVQEALAKRSKRDLAAAEKFFDEIDAFLGDAPDLPAEWPHPGLPDGVTAEIANAYRRGGWAVDQRTADGLIVFRVPRPRYSCEED